MMKLIFETVFGRRTGTVDDGTSKSIQPNQPNPNNNRDVTLTRAPIGIRLNLRLRRTFLGATVAGNVNVAQGFAYCGPRFNSINKWAGTAYGITANRSSGINGTSGVTFQRLSELKVTGTRTSLDGKSALLEMIAGDDLNAGRQFKTNFTFPADITFPGEESFSGSSITFDSGVKKFDQTNV